MRNRVRVIVNSMFKNVLTVQILTLVISLLSLTVDGAVTGGMLNGECMTAYGLMLPLVTIVTAVVAAFGNGLTTIIGKDLGNGDFPKANRDLSGCLEYAFLISMVITTGLFVFSGNIADAFHTTGSLRQQAIDYLIGYSVGIPAQFVGLCIMPILQITGKKKCLISSMATMTLVNIVLDLLNGAVFHLGLLGMGLATSLGNIAALIVVLIGFVDKSGLIKFQFVKPKAEYMKEILIYGMPGATAMICRNVLCIILNALLLSVAGAKAVAAYTAIMSVLNLAMALGSGIGGSVSMLTGVFFGERDHQNIRETFRLGIVYSVVLNAVVSLILLALAVPIIHVFAKSNPEIIDMASIGLRIMGLCLVFYSVNAVLRFYYQASGAVVVAYSYAFINCLVCIALPALLMTKFWGVIGVWISYPVGELLTIAVMLAIVLFSSKNKGNISNKILRIPESFYRDSEVFSEKITAMEQVTAVSEKVRQFILANDTDRRKAYFLSLAVEELAKNTILYGFADNKDHNVEILLKKDTQNDGWIICIRDDCPLFNLVEYAKTVTEAERFEHIGIRMIMNLAKDVKYVGTFKTNCVSIVIH